MFLDVALSLCLSGLTEDVSGLCLRGQQGVADAVDVLSHDPDDVLTTLDQFGNLKQKIKQERRGCQVSGMLKVDSDPSLKYTNIAT